MSDRPPASIKPLVTVDDFSRLDIRVGRVVKVSDVSGSRKLVRLDVSFGDHRRTILAGLKGERERPEEIEGRQAIFLVNLEPKEMAGHISEGMLLDIGYADGLIPVLAIPEADVPDGTRLG